MFLCTITDNYIRYLSQTDSRVLSNHENNRTYIRPHVGIIIQNNGIDYFVPLSSKHSKDYDQNGKIKSNTMTIKYLVNNHQLLGKLLLNNMIPVPPSECILIDLNKSGKSSDEIKYIDLLNNELKMIRSMKKEIIRDCQKVYRLKIHENDLKYWPNSYRPGWLKATVDFQVLELKHDEWISSRNNN